MMLFHGSLAALISWRTGAAGGAAGGAAAGAPAGWRRRAVSSRKAWASFLFLLAARAAPNVFIARREREDGSKERSALDFFVRVLAPFPPSPLLRPLPPRTTSGHHRDHGQPVLRSQQRAHARFRTSTASRRPCDPAHRPPACRTRSQTPPSPTRSTRRAQSTETRRRPSHPPPRRRPRTSPTAGGMTRCRRG